VFFCALLLSAIVQTFAFISVETAGYKVKRIRDPSLYEGVGVADKYSWYEEQFEIEINVTVPPNTAAKDVKFKCSSDSIDLSLGDGTILLDGSRKVRGKIQVDGSFVVFEDEAGSSDKERTITVTIEKQFVPVSSVGGTQTFDTLTDFDWGGIYLNDDEEVSHRKYDKPEELNVREYAAKLGVDTDNIDMSKVDKNMFAGTGDGAINNEDETTPVDQGGKDGFRFDTETLDQLINVGLAKEIVKRGDGSEYEMGDGRAGREFSMLGKDISAGELAQAGIVGETDPSMFDQNVPVEEAPGFRQSFDSKKEDGTIETE